MHEAGIMQQALDVAVRQAQAAGAKKIIEIVLDIGRLSGVVEEALEFAFRSLRNETIAADARLIVRQVAASAECDDCHLVFEPEELVFCCPNCESLATRIVKGRDLTLARIEYV